MVHRDLKPDNILITSINDPRADISDFGTLTITNSTHVQSNTLVGTPFYIAPEVADKLHYSFASDYYALGFILWELFTQRIPYYNLPEYQSSLGRPLLLLNVIHKNVERPPFDEILNYPTLIECIKQLWDKDVENRKSIKLPILLKKIDMLG